MKPTIKQIKAYVESITPKDKKLSEETILAIAAIYANKIENKKGNK